jgi:hypothetical protein
MALHIFFSPLSLFPFNEKSCLAATAGSYEARLARLTNEAAALWLLAVRSKLAWRGAAALLRSQGVFWLLTLAVARDFGFYTEKPRVLSRDGWAVASAPSSERRVHGEAHPSTLVIAKSGGLSTGKRVFWRECVGVY